MNKNILGLDLSLTETGVCRIATDGDYFYAFDIIKSKKKDIDRLIDIKETLNLWTGSLQYDLIVIEGYGFATYRGHSLGELGGVIKVFLREKYPNTPILLIPPTVLKKFITGKGNANKSIMLLEIYKKWKISFDNHNVADAYALARFGEMYLNLDGKKKNNELRSKVVEIR